MPHQITRPQRVALHHLAIALRPEWSSRSPENDWQTRISHNTFPHAESFEHCVLALIDYCQASSKGQPVYKFPTLYPDAGEHWTTTIPLKLEKNPRDPCPDHPMDRNNRHNCIGCRSEIISGMRPKHKQGSRWTPGLPM